MLEILLAGGAIILDRISKLWCLGSLKQMPGMKMDVIPGIVEFRYVENRGAAFSILSGRTGLLTVVTALIIAGLIFYLVKYGRTESLLVRILLSLIIGGALGNFIDRIVYGFVIDFINPTFIRFAVFNVADIFVTCGAILLVFAVLFLRPSKKQNG